MKIHIVQSGDSLTKLARKYHISEDQIVKANPNLEKGQQLQTGSKIYIPSGKIRLTKEVEKGKDRTEQERELKPSFEQSNVAFDSSSQQELAPEAAKNFEDEYPEPAPFPTGWTPYPPLTPNLWACSYYPMMPPHPYGQINSMQFSPYYYPYTYWPSFQNVGDPYHLPYADESSSYYTRSKWDPDWAEKESSSVEG